MRGRGLLLGIELVSDRDARRPRATRPKRVLYRALSRGLSFKTTMGNVLTLTPPLTITEPQMDQALDIIDDRDRGAQRTRSDKSLTSRASCPGSIVPRVPARAEGWIPGTSPGMTTRAGSRQVHTSVGKLMAGNLGFDELKAAVKAGTIDTVLVAMVDMQGRLIGKRFQARVLR